MSEEFACNCPTCGTIAGLACEDADGYRQPRRTHPARIEYLRAIERIYECLNENYLPEGVQFWLDAMNRNLGMQRPSDLIASGRVAEVLAEAEQLAGGAW